MRRCHPCHQPALHRFLTGEWDAELQAKTRFFHPLGREGESQVPMDALMRCMEQAAELYARCGERKKPALQAEMIQALNQVTRKMADRLRKYPLPLPQHGETGLP